MYPDAQQPTLSPAAPAVQPQQQPYGQAVGGAPAPASERRGRKWLRGWRLAVVIVGGIIAALLLADVTQALLRDTRLWDAKIACNNAGSVTDGGRTLTIDMTGGADERGSAYTAADATCVLDELQTPTSIITLMETTRAIDGRQTDEWDGLTATWSYHPDNGLDIVIEKD
jgi:hypothetical protein